MILDSETLSSDTEMKNSDRNIKNSKVCIDFSLILIKANSLNSDLPNSDA